jgi:hypothetical protein
VNLKVTVHVLLAGDVIGDDDHVLAHPLLSDDSSVIS